MTSIDQLRDQLKREETFEELTREPDPVDDHEHSDPKTLLTDKRECPDCDDGLAAIFTVTPKHVNGKEYASLRWRCESDHSFKTTSFFDSDTLLKWRDETLAKGKKAAAKKAAKEMADAARSVKGVGISAKAASDAIIKFGASISAALPLPALPPMPKLPPIIVPSLPSIPSLPALPFNTHTHQSTKSRPAFFQRDDIPAYMIGTALIICEGVWAALWLL